MSLIQTIGLQLPQKSQLGSGNPVGAPSGILGELALSEVLPRYSTLTKMGKVFTARGALQTLSIAGTAMTGLVLWNSSNSTDLHLLKASGDVAVTSATMTGIALAYGQLQPLTPITVTAAQQACDYIAATAQGAGKTYTAATMSAAPVAQFDLLHNTAAIATTGEDAGFLIDFEGSIIIPPGYWVAPVALGAASAASAVNLSLKWVELPA